MQDTSNIITKASAKRAGAFTLAEVVARGGSSKVIADLVARGLVRRLHRGVYFAGAVPTLAGRRWCAVLAAGSDALLGGRAALDEYGLTRVPDDRIEVVVARRQRPLLGVRVIESRTLHREDRRRWNGLPITSVERALVDVAHQHSTFELCRMLREGAFRKLLSISRLERTIERNPRRAGIATLRGALELHRCGHGGIDSDGEAVFARMLQRAGLTFAANVTIVVHGERMRVDFYVEHLGLVIEFDPPNHDLAPVAREDALRTALCRSAGLDHLRVRSNRKREGVRAIMERQHTWSAAGSPERPPLAAGAYILDAPSAPSPGHGRRTPSRGRSAR